VYDEAKRFAEAITMGYRRNKGVDTRSCGSSTRSANGCAPTTAGHPDVHHPGRCAGTLTVAGDGSQTRSGVHVDDLIEASSRWLHSPTRAV